MKKGSSIVGVLVVVVLSIACSEVATPVSPSRMPTATSAAASMASTTLSTAYTQPTIMMLPDYTVSPSFMQVKVGTRVKFVNNSGRYFQIHSYNCSQFQMVDPYPGSYNYSGIFKTARRVCDYFAWDTNWSRKLMEGKVEVVP